MNYYKILLCYNLSDTHFTLVLESVQQKEIKGKKIFGTFSMNLMNADDVELDTIADKSFINLIKKDNVFFADIKKEYYHIISNGENIEGWIIIEPN